MAYVDVLFLVIVGFGFLVGLLTNWYRRLIGLLIFVSLLLIYYFGFHDYMWHWLEYDSFAFLHQIGVLKSDVIEFYVESADTTFRIACVKDAFTLLQNLDFTSAGLVQATCDGLCQAICLTVVVIVLIPVSFILSFILYWVLFRWIMPAPARSGTIAHLFGGIFGLIENTVVAVVLITALGYLSAAGGTVVVDALKDQTSQLSILFVEKLKVLSYNDLSQIAVYVELAGGTMNPLSESSVVVRPIFEMLTQIGLDPFNIISVEYVNDAGEKVRESFKTSFSNFVSDLVNKGIEKMNEGLS